MLEIMYTNCKKKGCLCFGQVIRTNNILISGWSGVLKQVVLLCAEFVELFVFDHINKGASVI